MTQQTRKTPKSLIIVAAIAMVVILTSWLTSPKIEHPPVTGEFDGPENIAAIFKRSCYDCHSNETKLQWYDKLSPISWIVAADVKEARSRFNFSTWKDQSPADQQGRLWEIVNMVRGGRMPLKSYLTLHPRARLTPAEVRQLEDYVNSFPKPPLGDTGRINAANREFERYQQQFETLTKTPADLDSIKYPTNFKSWQVIATTNRFDNQTLRVVYGNDIAVKAIRNNTINPWPDGSSFVKLSWARIKDADGQVTSGTFVNVQIMEKNDNLFPDTKGWGFARYVGTGLKPYNPNKMVAQTCFNCHKMADATGYVFDVPFRQKEVDPHATTNDPLLFDAKGEQVITSFANEKDSSLSTLYGNAAAIRSTILGNTQHAAGEVFTLVTWAQADSKNCYGVYINGRIRSVETVQVNANGDNPPVITYRLEQGETSHGQAGNAYTQDERIKHIFGQRAAVFP